MRLFFLSLLFACSTFTFAENTEKDFLGKWKLVKVTSSSEKNDKNAENIPLKEFLVNNNTEAYQIYKANNQFTSISSGEEFKGTWKLSKSKIKLLINYQKVVFNIIEKSDTNYILQFKNANSYIKMYYKLIPKDKH